MYDTKKSSVRKDHCDHRGRNFAILAKFQKHLGHFEGYLVLGQIFKQLW